MRNEKHGTVYVGTGYASTGALDDRTHQITSSSISSSHSISSQDRDTSEYLDLKPATSDEGLALAQRAVEIAIEFKGLDVRGIDLQGISDITDYFVIISGTSERHVKGLADNIRENMPERPSDMNGYETGEWVLLDYGNVIVHIFYEPSRQHYAFDALWDQAESIELDAKLEQAVRKLRTGLIR